MSGLVINPQTLLLLKQHISEVQPVIMQTEMPGILATVDAWVEEVKKFPQATSIVEVMILYNSAETRRYAIAGAWMAAVKKIYFNINTYNDINGIILEVFRTALINAIDSLPNTTVTEKQALIESPSARLASVLLLQPMLATFDRVFLSNDEAIDPAKEMVNTVIVKFCENEELFSTCDADLPGALARELYNGLHNIDDKCMEFIDANIEFDGDELDFDYHIAPAYSVRTIYNGIRRLNNYVQNKLQIWPTAADEDIAAFCPADMLTMLEKDFAEFLKKDNRVGAFALQFARDFPNKFAIKFGKTFDQHSQEVAILHQFMTPKQRTKLCKFNNLAKMFFEQTLAADAKQCAIRYLADFVLAHPLRAVLTQVPTNVLEGLLYEAYTYTLPNAVKSGYTTASAFKWSEHRALVATTQQGSAALLRLV